MGVVLVVAGCVLAAASPWWVARAVVERRATSAGRTPLRSDGTMAERPVIGVASWTAGRPGGASRPLGEREARVEIGVLLELLAAAVRAGASVPRALDAVGAAAGGPDGAGLRAAGTALVLGASWDAAWSGCPARIAVVQRALRPAWAHGAAPAPSLRAAGEALRQDRTAAAKTAASRLAVHLVLPLGACYLPAFVLVGLLPVLLSLGSGLLG